VLVAAAQLAPAGVAVLDAAGAEVVYAATPADGERLLASIAFDAVISRVAPLTGAMIASCPSLRVIAKHGVGVNNIDLAEATRRGIPVYTTPGANAASVAELTIGLMLALARRIPWLDAEVRAGRWPGGAQGVQLGGRRLGLVGLGDIGTRVALAAQALGMAVHGLRRAGARPAPPGVTLHDTLPALLAQSDVLSLHLPLTEATRGLVGAPELALLPPGALLVNTARGEIVDEPALVAALRSGALAGAALDALSQEPLPAGHVLTTLPTVLLTPHIGGATSAALAAMAETAARQLLDHLAGRPIEASRCANPTVLGARFSPA
jgi:D-3-phosphoglycerate dehydrogenase